MYVHQVESFEKCVNFTLHPSPKPKLSQSSQILILVLICDLKSLPVRNEVKSLISRNDSTFWNLTRGITILNNWP